MPLVLILVGVVFLIAAVRDQLGTLLSLIKGDFTGSGNFVYFVAAIFVIGAIGYSDRLKPLSDAFLFLVILVLFIHNKGVFSNFQSALGTTTQPNSAGNFGPEGAASSPLLQGVTVTVGTPIGTTVGGAIGAMGSYP